ncbi:hypothetical protein [Nocardioides panaciterrulae]|uniref:Dienelactone hydrolase n=1 Tax=Nocardioides panaciterrulae TaxID=661492 RepID=A0A7Y9J9Z7_9ACTN|nr:hypothetical protein [Nocardioides panaciterrulae]NYD40883.1 dienelactone hydrolase [Nocardioides panaciterrulae]
MSERVTADTFLARPLTPCGTGVLVLAGSSGRIEQDRAELLARHGAAAMAMRWFGGAGQRPAPHEVPLELFVGAVDRLAADCERVAIIGASFGAEAALLTAVHDARVAAVVGLAPTSVVWGAYAEERWSSHWTLGGHPLPYVPLRRGLERRHRATCLPGALRVEPRCGPGPHGRGVDSGRADLG